MDDPSNPPLKRQTKEPTKQKPKKPKNKRNAFSLPPSQEKSSSSGPSKSGRQSSATDFLHDREACSEAIKMIQAAVQDQSVVQSASREVTPSQCSSIQSSPQFSQGTQTITNVPQLEDETGKQKEPQQEQKEMKEGWNNMKDVKDLIKVLKVHMDGVDHYIDRAPARESRKDEIAILDKYVVNMENISTALKDKKTGQIKIMVTLDTTAESEISRQLDKQTEASRRERIFETGRIRVTNQNQATEQPKETDGEEGLPATLVKKLNELIEGKLRKAQQEITVVKETSGTSGKSKEGTPKKREETPRELPPPPSSELQRLCLEKAKEYAAQLKDSKHTPSKPSALWITSFDNREVHQIIDEANYTTLPGMTTYGPAWEGALAIKVNFRSEEKAKNAAVIFRRNIRLLGKDTISLLHIGLPSFGAWKPFELRTDFIKVTLWEKVMNTTNINDPAALNTLINNICEWNRGTLWNRDIQRAHLTHGKEDPNVAALVLKTGPLTFDYYKVLKKLGRAYISIKGMEKSVAIELIYTPYCCWGCFEFTHLKNTCPNKTQWSPNYKNGDPHCGLCESEGLANFHHKAAAKGCPTFDSWAEKLEEECVYFQGGY